MFNCASCAGHAAFDQQEIPRIQNSPLKRPRGSKNGSKTKKSDEMFSKDSILATLPISTTAEHKEEEESPA